MGCGPCPWEPTGSVRREDRYTCCETPEQAQCSLGHRLSRFLTSPEQLRVYGCDVSRLSRCRSFFWWPSQSTSRSRSSGVSQDQGGACGSHSALDLSPGMPHFNKNHPTARHCSSGFRVTISFNPQNNSIRDVCYYPESLLCTTRPYCPTRLAMPLVVCELGQVNLTETQISL